MTFVDRICNHRICSYFYEAAPCLFFVCKWKKKVVSIGAKSKYDVYLKAK